MLLLCAALGMLGTLDSKTPVSDLPLIDEFNSCIQLRFGFEAPLAQFQALGPVWAATNSAFLRGTGAEATCTPRTGHESSGSGEPSFGQHFVPLFNTTRDFMPENEREKKALAALENVPLQAGFYFFGRAIADAPMVPPNYRALKGPAAITEGAPRPAWYPTATNPVASPDALPDWKTIYPVARKAMKRFADGEAGFETPVGSWQIAARPILASQQRCVACHNALGFATSVPAELNHALGGVLYAFRRTSI